MSDIEVNCNNAKNIRRLKTGYFLAEISVASIIIFTLCNIMLFYSGSSFFFFFSDYLSFFLWNSSLDVLMNNGSATDYYACMIASYAVLVPYAVCFIGMLTKHSYPSKIVCAMWVADILLFFVLVVSGVISFRTDCINNMAILAFLINGVLCQRKLGRLN